MNFLPKDADDIDIDVEGEADIEFGPDYEDELGVERVQQLYEEQKYSNWYNRY